MSKTKIEWCDRTWNPIHGCTQISEGCQNCYAKRVALWLQSKGENGYIDNGFDLTPRPDRLKNPCPATTKPQIVFVCSMSDMFHPAVQFEFIDSMFEIMVKYDQHTYVMLTKRPENLLAWERHNNQRINHVRRNWYFGVSVENQRRTVRIHDLIQSESSNLVLSMEPLLEEITIPHLDRFSGVYCGGETGRGARITLPSWIRSIQNQCLHSDVPFFFKAWGEWMPSERHIPGVQRISTPEGYMYKVGKKKSGNLLDGQAYKELPR